MAVHPPVAKYIIKKAVQLNNLDKKQKDLIDNIKNWMELSGFTYAGIYDESGIIQKLVDGEFKNENDINKAFNDATAHVPNYIIKKAVQLNAIANKQKALITAIKRWMELSGYQYTNMYDIDGIIMKLALGEFENEDEIVEAFKKLTDEL